MQERLARSERGLALLDPQLVLQRGYAWLADEAGATVVDASQVQAGQALRATLAKGQIDLTVK
jgi:exodeoxyribonuclease VII large subunit